MSNQSGNYIHKEEAITTTITTEEERNKIKIKSENYR